VFLQGVPIFGGEIGKIFGYILRHYGMIVFKPLGSVMMLA
jgi:hypothetical protein